MADTRGHALNAAAEERGAAFSRYPQDSPWYPAEQFCADTLAWVERVEDALNGVAEDDE